MNTMSLFSGIGGLDLGLQRAGMTVAGQVEIDPYCRRVLAKHWPEVDRHDDVRTAADWWRSVPRPRLDLIAAGFPCQPSSTAGRRGGDTDDRWLWPAAAEVVRALRPRWVILENPPGILSVRLPRRDRDLGLTAGGNRGAGAVLADLAALGYDAQWGCVSAADLGAPHRRDRWWCIAHLADADGQRRGQGRAGGPAGTSPDRQDVPAPGMADADGERRGGRRGGDRQAAERRQGHREPARGREDVADADGPPRRPDPRHAVRGTGGAAAEIRPLEPRRRRGGRERELGQPWPAPEPDGWWSPEPRMGGALAGFPHWLDGSGLLEESEMAISEHAAQCDRNPAEVMRDVRGEVLAEIHQRTPGRWECLPTPEILLALLRQLEGAGRTQRPVVAGTQTQGAGVRGVRGSEAAACPSCRRGPGQQCGGRHPDTVQQLSQLLACRVGAAWDAYLRSDAAIVLSSGDPDGLPAGVDRGVAEPWERGTPRLAANVPDRPARLRALGNAAVPQVAEHIGRIVIAAARVGRE